MIEAAAFEPFVMVYDDFIVSNKFSCTQKIVYLILKSFTDNRTHQCFPSIKTIAMKCGLCSRTINDCINKLDEGKAIVRKNRCFAGSNIKTSNLYTLNDDKNIWENEDSISDIEKERDKEVERFCAENGLTCRKKEEKRRFVKISKDFLNNKLMSGMEKILFIAMKLYSSGKNICRIGTIKLSKLLNITPATVRKYRNRLIEKGLLEVNVDTFGKDDGYILIDSKDIWKSNDADEIITEKKKIIYSIRYIIEKAKDITEKKCLQKEGHSCDAINNNNSTKGHLDEKNQSENRQCDSENASEYHETARMIANYSALVYNKDDKYIHALDQIIDAMSYVFNKKGFIKIAGKKIKANYIQDKLTKLNSQHIDALAWRLKHQFDNTEIKNQRHYTIAALWNESADDILPKVINPKKNTFNNYSQRNYSQEELNAIENQLLNL